MAVVRFAQKDIIQTVQLCVYLVKLENIKTKKAKTLANLVNQEDTKMKKQKTSVKFRRMAHTKIYQVKAQQKFAQLIITAQTE